MNVMVSPATTPGSDSGSSTLKTIWLVLAPMAWAASMRPRSTSRSADGEWHDRCRRADRRAHHETRERDHGDEQDDERRRAHGIDDHAHHAIRGDVLQHAVTVGEIQQHAERQADGRAHESRDAHHDERL